MTTPRARYHQVPTKAEKLRREASEAAEVRDALTHPDVVALRVEKLRERVDRFIWSGMVLGLLFTMTNVQQFTAHTMAAGPGSLGWWAAWLLDPTVSVILLGVLLAEREVSRWQIQVGPWARAAKWSLLAATYVMNTWESYAAGNLAGIVLHSVPPLAVFMGAEAVTDCQEKLTECVHRAHAAAVRRAAERARAKQALVEEAANSADTDRDNRIKDAETDARIQVIRSQAGVTVAEHAAAAVATRTGPTVFGQTGPDRSGVAPQTGPGPHLRPVPAVGPDRSERRLQTGPSDDFRPVPDRSGARSHTGPNTTTGPVSDRSETRTQTGPAKRSGTARKTSPGRPGKPASPRQQTDADLLPKVRELADQNDGEPPTKYQLKQALGIGNDRAARLLDQLDPEPAGAPEANGAAKAGQHS